MIIEEIKEEVEKEWESSEKYKEGLVLGRGVM
jgi:hypothetical protein